MKMNIKMLLRRRTRHLRLLVLMSVFSVGFIIYLQPIKMFTEFFMENNEEIVADKFLSRKLLSNDTGQSLYPPETFSLEQRKNGAVVLHVIGMIYMFVALALVCDEFFVPSLAVITEKLQISEDVAGATFMAAGGSAPELFTSLIGVFLAKNNVGIGTIVGSAVFNILFVIGMCALFSKGALQLTWWPLFRDITFYSIYLLLLIRSFWDEWIEWWEALILFIGYILYILFMKFNHNIEAWVKSKIRKCRGKVESENNLLNVDKPERTHSMPILHSGGNRYRHGMLQLMIHTIDPLHEGKVHDKAMHLHALATLKVVIGTTAALTENGTVQNGVDKDNNMTKVHTISNGYVGGNSEHSPDKGDNQLMAISNKAYEPDARDEVQLKVTDETNPRIEVSTTNSPEMEAECSTSPDNEEPKLEEDEEPLDLSWPDGWRKRITYILIAPLIFPMWLFLPDVRRPEKRKWFFLTFIGSILSIGIFSYFMVWWANQTGDTIGISNEVMGLTILAAGTSIPDLITSVIVAKKGFGDMAVSSSVGSNIFDITVGLPFPWLLYAAIFSGAAISVDSNGLVCSIFLLFLMLIALLVTVAATKWKMSKVLGVIMLVLYVVFLVLSVLLELRIIICPIEV